MVERAAPAEGAAQLDREGGPSDGTYCTYAVPPLVAQAGVLAEPEKVVS